MRRFNGGLSLMMAMEALGRGVPVQIATMELSAEDVKRRLQSENDLAATVTGNRVFLVLDETQEIRDISATTLLSGEELAQRLKDVVRETEPGVPSIDHDALARLVLELGGPGRPAQERIYNLVATQTGRLRSDQPNLANTPRPSDFHSYFSDSEMRGKMESEAYALIDPFRSMFPVETIRAARRYPGSAWDKTDPTLSLKKRRKQQARIHKANRRKGSR